MHKPTPKECNFEQLQALHEKLIRNHTKIERKFHRFREFIYLTAPDLLKRFESEENFKKYVANREKYEY